MSLISPSNFCVCVHRVTLLNHSVIGLHKYVSSNQQEAQVCRGWCLPYRAEQILTREGHSSCDVTLVRTENIIRATRTQQVFGEKGRRIRKLSALVQTRPVSQEHRRTLAEKL
jgi:ribosomal protein S3